MNCLDSLSFSTILCDSSKLSAIAALFSALAALFMIVITYKIYKWSLVDKNQENELSHYFDYVVVYSMNLIDERRNKLEQLIENLEILHRQSNDVNSLRLKIDEIQNCYGAYKQKVFNRLKVFDKKLAADFNSFFEKKKDDLTTKLQQFSMSNADKTLDKNDLFNFFDEAIIALKERKFS